MQSDHQWSNMMNLLSALALTTCTLLFGLPLGDAIAQQKPLSEQIAGAWTYVAVDTVRPDGSRVSMYGPNPQGLVIFDGNGHYALVNARADQPKIASNNRMQATPEEYKTSCKDQLRTSASTPSTRRTRPSPFTSKLARSQTGTGSSRSDRSLWLGTNSSGQLLTPRAVVPVKLS
jgi:hypothetical protein